MPKLFLSAAYLLFALCVAGCDVSQSQSVTPAQASKYAVDRFFKDPKAQALAVAAEQGNVDEVQRLMKQEHVNPDVVFSEDGSGMPLIAWPVFTENPTGLKAMLDNGANPNTKQLHPAQDTTRFKGRYQNNAMVWAAKAEDPIYLKELLDHGGDSNTRNSNGETLLFQAYIWHDQWQNVQLLVERGADINALSQQMSILYDYTSMGRFEKAYWLLNHGADPRLGTLIIQPAPPAPQRYLAVEDIFWHPGDPKDPSWQRKCQQWLLQHGFTRPPMPKDYRDMRKNFGLPYEEKDIPLL